MKGIWERCLRGWKCRRLLQNLRALVLTAFVVVVSTSAMADTVLSVGDGKTLTVSGVSGRRTIRLACDDAPETAQRSYGYAARAALKNLAPVGSSVQIKAGAQIVTAGGLQRPGAAA